MNYQRQLTEERIQAHIGWLERERQTMSAHIWKLEGEVRTLFVLAIWFWLVKPMLEPYGTLALATAAGLALLVLPLVWGGRPRQARRKPPSGHQSSRPSPAPRCSRPPAVSSLAFDNGVDVLRRANADPACVLGVKARVAAPVARKPRSLAVMAAAAE